MNCLCAQRTLTLHWGEEDLRHGRSLGPFVLRDGFSMTGLAAQSHVALHHGVSCHGAHWGRRRDCRDRQTEHDMFTNVRYEYRISDLVLNLYVRL